jgi:hypothetical protein
MKAFVSKAEERRYKTLALKPKVPSFTEVHVHKTTCVHTIDGEMCNEPVILDEFKGFNQNGWLCSKHDERVFRKPVAKNVH